MLELLAAHRDGLTLTQLCTVTGWPKSSALALLRTMVHREYVADGRQSRPYRLGPRVAWLGASYLNGLDLVAEGQDIIRSVSRSCDETVHLATLHGCSVLYVAKEEGTSQMRMVSAVGKLMLAHGTGVGKVLLSGLREEELDALYPPRVPLPAITDATIVDRDRLMRELVEIRRLGYARDAGESTVGLQCIAAPVRDGQGRIVAAMSMSVPDPRFTGDRVPDLQRAVLAGAWRLSARLGYTGRPHPDANEGRDPRPGLVAEVAE